MVNLDLVIGRIEALKGITGDKFIAGALGISPQDFSNRKKRGTLLPVIFEWAINENIDLNWLMKGEGGSKLALPQPVMVMDRPEVYNPVVSRIDLMLVGMDEEAQRDVLKYAEEKKLLAECLKERARKKAA
jgi:hypothetical protein